MTFEADLNRLDQLATLVGMPRCGCHVFAIVLDGQPVPPPCPLHGYAYSFIAQIDLRDPRRFA